MNKLTKPQRLTLLSACDHELGCATRPERLPEAAAAKILASLIERGLAIEIRAKAGAPIWREVEGRGYALKISKAGRDAVAESPSDVATEPKATNSPVAAEGSAIAGPKTNVVLGLMRRKEGASIGTLTAATGWLPHTTRAALSVLRKKGIVIDRTKAGPNKESIYRIVEAASSGPA